MDSSCLSTRGSALGKRLLRRSERLMPALTKWPRNQLVHAPKEIDLLRTATSSGRSQPRDERGANPTGDRLT